MNLNAEVTELNRVETTVVDRGGIGNRPVCLNNGGNNVNASIHDGFLHSCRVFVKRQKDQKMTKRQEDDLNQRTIIRVPAPTTPNSISE